MGAGAVRSSPDDGLDLTWACSKWRSHQRPAAWTHSSKGVSSLGSGQKSSALGRNLAWTAAALVYQRIAMW